MESNPEARPILSAVGISKSFPGVKALKDVSFDLLPGELLAVIGENGAGKSTMMKILAGVQAADEGQVLIDGSPADLTSVEKATEQGIALIHQELNLPTNLTVAASMFLGREPSRFGFFDQRKIRGRSAEALARIELDCSPDELVGNLPIGKKQLVEIARALSAEARILIFDEPTSSLSAKETRRLYEVIDQLKDQGVSMIYISHRLGEVQRLADRVVVLRDGEYAGQLDRHEISHENMVRLMVGRDISQFYQRVSHSPGDVLLEARDFLSDAHPDKPVNFSIRAGEIVGIAGLVGAGRTELVESIFGVRQSAGGRLVICGREVVPQSPRDAISSGLALVPEDRKHDGLVLEMGVRENGSLPSLGRQARKGFVDSRKEVEAVDRMIADLKVKVSGREQVVQTLSGGNQQKIVIGKWLATEPRVLLMDEPTRGIDIGAKQEVYRLMHELSANGLAILFVSSEMEEIIGMSDRILVMHEGSIAGELPRDQFEEEKIMTLATGGAADTGSVTY
jgi:ribose transport system ATP-binding protein